MSGRNEDRSRFVGNGWRPRAATRAASSSRTRRGPGGSLPAPVRSNDRGMVTAELALAIPALAVVAVMLAWLVGLGVGQGMAVQAAREGARTAARGESAPAVRAATRAVLPGATVSVRRSGDLVAVTASIRRTPPLAFLRLWATDLSATATAWREQ